MSRVYLSFLGTNDYVPCTYVFPDGTDEPKNVRFVQEATVSYCCRDWGPDDQVVILTTDEAEGKNWVDDGHRDKEGNVLKRKGLQKCLAELGIGARVRRVPIPDGKKEEELWKIFEIILEQIREGAEVVFDVTHALRSIPMLAITALNYAKVMKGVSLRGIYYGAFEVLGSIEEAKGKPLANRRVPVFDLGMFDRLFEWSFALDRFLGAGDATHACELARRWSIRPLNGSALDKATQKHLTQLAEHLERFSKVMSTCRGREIMGAARALQDSIDPEAASHLPPPLRLLMGPLRDRLAVFRGELVNDGIEAARWCLEHNLIQQGITILREVLTQHMTVLGGGKPDSLDHRELVAAAVEIYRTGTAKENWRGRARGNPSLTEKYLEVLRSEPDLADVFTRLGDARNDMNHAGFREEAKNSSEFSQILNETIDWAKRFASQDPISTRGATQGTLGAHARRETGTRGPLRPGEIP